MAEGQARISNGDNFSVGSRIIGGGNAICPGRQCHPIFYNKGRERSASGRHVLRRQLDNFVDEFFAIHCFCLIGGAPHSVKSGCTPPANHTTEVLTVL